MHLLAAAFRVAARSGSDVRPAHLLIAIAEYDDGPIGAALAPLRPSVPGGTQGGGATSTFVFSQTQQAARAFALSRGELPAAPHLLVAVIDQGDAEAMTLLAATGLDGQVLRRTALAELGAPHETPPIELPSLTPAGTMDRPPLDVDALDPAVWRVLTWRQGHLPLHLVRSRDHAEALSALERRAAWRLADRAGVDDDQRYSLQHHHDAAVTERIAAAHPQFARQPRPPGRAVLVTRHGGRRRRRVPNFMVGWPSWFQNRRVGMRDRCFAARAAAAYRGQPGLNR